TEGWILHCAGDKTTRPHSTRGRNGKAATSPQLNDEGWQRPSPATARRKRAAGGASSELSMCPWTPTTHTSTAGQRTVKTPSRRHRTEVRPDDDLEVSGVDRRRRARRHEHRDVERARGGGSIGRPRLQFRQELIVELDDEPPVTECVQGQITQNPLPLCGGLV